MKIKSLAKNSYSSFENGNETNARKKTAIVKFTKN